MTAVFSQPRLPRIPLHSHMFKCLYSFYSSYTTTVSTSSGRGMKDVSDEELKKDLTSL